MARERLRLQEVGDEADGQPTYLFPDYRSTLLRAPTKPLLLVPQTLSELTGRCSATTQSTSTTTT